MLKVMKLLLIRFKVYMRILLILLRLLLIFMSMLKTLRIVLITYPPGLRDLFNNSPVEFWRQAGTPEFLEKFDKFTAAEGSKKKAANSSDNSGSNNGGNSFGGNGGTLNE